VHIVRSDSVHLNIETVGGQILLVDVIIVLPDVVDGGLVAAAAIRLFAEQHLSTSTVALGIVDAHLMVFGIEWLLHKWFLELIAADHYVIIVFGDLELFVL
jgi:hypothetical protein